MTVGNYAYLFYKHWPQTRLRKAAFWWTLLGLFLLYLPSSPGRQGVLHGVKRMMDKR
jgi:hypothetical protein